MRINLSKNTQTIEIRIFRTESLLLLVCGILMLLLVVRRLQGASGQNNVSSFATAFTYQGELIQDGAPANGVFDFEFRLWDGADSVNATQVGSSFAAEDVIVDDGLFMVVLDFGEGVFNGDARWLQIWVAADGESSLTALTPMQRITAVPYALYGEDADADPANELQTLTLNGNVLSIDQGNSVTLPGGTSNTAVQAGTVALPRAETFGSTLLQIPISFGAPFSEPPVIAVSPMTNDTNVIAGTHFSVQNVTTTGFELQVYQSAPAVTLTLDDYFNVGSYSSHVIVNGNPAVSYYDDTEEDLKYVRALDIDGSRWGSPMMVDGAEGVNEINELGLYPVMKIINGNPAIIYKQSCCDHELRYVRALDVNGDVWGTPIVVINEYSSGYKPALHVVNGNPAISYEEGGVLYFVRALDVDGSSWGSPITVATNINYLSMTVVNGYPAIAYHDTVEKDLMYVRALNANGSSWDTPTYIDGADLPYTDVWVGYYPSLTVVNGRPAISYQDYKLNSLKYVRALDAEGGSWGTPLALDNSIAVGFYTSLAVINGRPAISYYDDFDKDLMYIEALDVNGESWGNDIEVDTVGDMGMDPSLAEVNGRPAISYYDRSHADLKFAHPVGTEPYNLNWIAVAP